MILRCLFCLMPIFFVLLGCATAGTSTDRGAAASGNGDRETAHLYEQLAQATERYAQGSELLAAGQDRGGAEREVALEELRQAADRCAALRVCDIGRFFAAYDAIAQVAAVPAPITDAPLADAELQPESESLSPLLDAIPESERTITMLRGRPLADAISLNEPVKAAINEWLTWLRPNLIEAYENYQYMRFMMWPHYQQAGLPEALLFAIMARESQGKVHAVSRAGAAGPLQFMPATGRRFGLGRRDNDGFDTRFDPRESTRAQVAYLNEQFNRLNENLELVIAAYNGGEGRLGRLSGNGARSLWDPAVFNALPQETQIYVPMVLAAAYLFLHPEEYGLSFPNLNTVPAVLVLQRPASLNELAVCLGHADGSRAGWFRALRNLNPQYDNARVLSEGTQLEVPAVLVSAYEARCVDGDLVARAAALNTARMPVSQPSPARQVMAGQPVTGSGARSHTVRSGESLYAISRRHGCNMQTLARNNAIAGPRYLLRAGQRLNLSGCRT